MIVQLNLPRELRIDFYQLISSDFFLSTFEMNISFVNRYRYFIYRHDCEMRKGDDRLCGLVNNEFKMSPLSGDVFVSYSKLFENGRENYLFASSHEATQMQLPTAFYGYVFVSAAL